MKYSLVLIILFLTNAIYCQSPKDTAFIFRKNDSTGYQAIFIENPNSLYHKVVFDLLLADKTTYYDKLLILDSLGKHKKQESNFNNLGEWISIYTYKGKKYGYFPSEPFFNLLIIVTDSTVTINNFNDGLTPFAIKKMSVKSNKYIYKLINPEKKIIDLTFILKRNNIVIIKSEILNKRKLMLIKKESFFNLPIIVNHCPGYRCGEFQF